MADITEISKAIERKKQLEKNLPSYATTMKSLYNRLGNIMLAFNYYMMAEQMEELVVSKEVRELFDELTEIITRNTTTIPSEKEREADLQKLVSMRENIISTMEILTAYVDRFAIYEHLLNRLEFSFSEEEFDEEYYDTHFTNDIMHYILGNSDNTVTNQRICEMVSQLPMRMSRQKFFELLKDSFMLYKGSDLSAVNDFAYMIRTLSGIYTPKEMDTKFLDIKELYDVLSVADYATESKEEYEKLADTLSVATEMVSGLSDFYMNLMDIVNNTYIITMTGDSAILDVRELQACKNIILEAIGNNTDVDVNDCFIQLEGHQERIYAQISSNDHIIDMVQNDLWDDAKNAKVTTEFEQLAKCAKLSSGSLFVDLKQNGPSKKAEENDILAIYEDILGKLQNSFKDRAVVINRAVMAIILGSLPVFFNNVDEIQAYINTALTQCRNKAERLACVSLIKMIMDEAQVKKWFGIKICM